MDPTLKISLIVLAATIWGYINYRNHRKSREAPELAAPPPNIQIAEEELAAAAAGEEPTAPSPAP